MSLPNTMTAIPAKAGSFELRNFCIDMYQKRVQLGLSIRSAAETCKISKTKLQAIEAGRVPDVSDFAAICSGLKLNKLKYF